MSNINESEYKFSNGEVVSMQPMNSYPEYFIYESIELLALASVNHNVESRTIPCVSWRFMKVSSAQQEPILKPFLLFSADNMLEIYRIKQIKTSEMVHEKFLSLKLDFDISAFHSIDLSHVNIVGGFIGYRTIDKGISQYFKQYGNMLTIRQIGTHNFVFYILGIYGPFRLSLRKWDKRIEFLIERGEYEKVIIFIAELLSNKASCFFGQAIVKKARINLLDKARNILIIYSEKLLNFDNYFSIITFTKKIKFIIKIAFQVGISQVLFSEIYDIFSILEENHYKCNNKLNNSKELISQCKPILFDNITPFICKKSCIYINARFAREYLVYLIDNSNFELFNLIVPKIDMKCLDINLLPPNYDLRSNLSFFLKEISHGIHIIRTAKKYMLFDIIIYFYNVSLNDYITPFYEMFEVLISKYLQLYNGSNKVDDWNDDKSNCSGSLKKELDQVGNKLISYLTMCLNGIHLSPSYFFDYSELSEINSLEIKNSILRILVTYRSNNSEYDYPYIYFLLKFDSFQFCGMMECAFKSRIFGLENGIDDIQNVIDIMIEIIESNDFDSVTKQNFYNFLAQQLCIFKRQLTASMELIETIVEHLTLNHIDHLDRHETTIIKLIKNYGFEMFDVESLEKVCIERNFNLVREQIYMHQRKFDCIIYCYIEQGNEREKCIFKLISNLLSLKDLSREEAKKIKNALLINVEKLLAIDNFSATYTFVIECEISTETIMSYLKDDKTIYSFLDAIYNNRDRYFNDTSIAQNSIKRYIELKCDWDPSSVEHFFRDFTEYNTHECIKICYRKKNLMGSLYLLERIGGYSEAYRLLLQQISETIKSYQINVESDGVINENNALTKILQLTSEKLIFWESSVNDFNCKDLWFNLLNLFLEDRQFEDVSKIPIYRMSMCYLLKQLSNTTYYYDSLDKSLTFTKIIKMSFKYLLPKYNVNVKFRLFCTEYCSVFQLPKSSCASKKFLSKAFRGKLGDIRDILNAIVGNFKHDQVYIVFNVIRVD
ncbi:hypothetical protein A3Q56_00822 [Intoshia linei]|uniref:Vacuolar protein sorting-associated protein 8 central domain-containing protein n=1 Tax=Intoshia linei TaxID=1819745 RepID=A0A177BD32_9BILA|nr:hypothetical protein A3Q56_00822 [Intoshia linei]